VVKTSFDKLIKNEYDEIYWYEKEVISFHIIYHLCKYLGFDPLTFTPLNDIIFFPKNEIRFFRFHFLALPYRKMSSHVRDIILTSDNLVSLYNTTFESMGPSVAEAFFQGILDTLMDLVSLKYENRILIEINEDFIIDVLEKYFGSSIGDPLFYWKRQENLGQSIKIFNKRKIFMKNQ